MLNLRDYENRLTFPRKEHFTTTYYYKGGQVVGTFRPGDKIHAVPEGAVKETVVNEDAYKIARAEHGRHEARLRDLFIVDLLADNGVEDNEFTRALYDVAYQQGHSSGYHEIESVFGDLCRLDTIAKRVYGK